MFGMWLVHYMPTWPSQHNWPYLELNDVFAASSYFILNWRHRVFRSIIEKIFIFRRTVKHQMVFWNCSIFMILFRDWLLNIPHNLFFLSKKPVLFIQWRTYPGLSFLRKGFCIFFGSVLFSRWKPMYPTMMQLRFFSDVNLMVHKPFWWWTFK